MELRHLNKALTLLPRLVLFESKQDLRQFDNILTNNMNMILTHQAILT